MIQLGFFLLLWARAFAYPALTPTPAPATTATPALSAPSTAPATTAPTSMTTATPSTVASPSSIPTPSATFTSTSTYTSLSREACSNVPIVQDFDLDKFQGRWFILGKYAIVTNALIKCITAYWSLNDEGTLDAEIALIDVIYNVALNYSGVATFTGTEGRYTVEYDSVDYGEHRIVYTDYEHIAIKLSCADVSIDGENNLLILGREQQIDKDSFVDALQFIIDHQLNNVPLVIEDWSECPDLTC
ncbi:apolipoprotein D-like [Belonocnema kinseyi]|uniref:apolipoprotein D-like n=1 Tax=Belonocnema kinseyi TaxID=2817044 RepID=UPI00143D0E80|nr:apolipoprotein D-like [Belonocnema kinseyi]XP_033212778.1 apolipoprotein D-like [Belonocnema kinseyi]